MKKQFNRMKQLANQTVGRAEKTEVLSDDLLQIERRMELMRVVSHNTHKKMASCLQGHMGAEAEKRHSVPRLYPGNGQRKLPLSALSQAMVEGGAQLGDDSSVGKMLEVCGEVENRLATELMQHELQLEKEVLDPLSQLAEVEIPNILKQRKHLAKLVLDYDSARTRWLQATKSIISGTNTQALTAKADLLKEELDEAMNKVELCKDQLAADMYSFFSREADYAQHFITLLEAQADHHRKSLSVLDGVLPAIRAQQDSWMEKPAFGTALDDHLKRSGRDIAVPMEACVMMLLETGMKEEGLFRVAAGASKLKKLKAALDCSTSQLEEFYSDPHAVAGALKSYLRELPDPLMTSDLYDEWIQASSVSDPDKRLQALWLVCDKLPKNNRSNLRYLVKFLARLAQDSESNKMTPSNMAIVLGPSLLWAQTDGSLADMAAASSVQVVAILEPIIQHADWFFPEDVEFNVSGMFVMPLPAAASNHSGPPDGDVERRRSGAMGDAADAARRDSSTKQADPPLRRGTSTFGRKQHISPAFQPPLPPMDAPILGHGVPQGPQAPQVDPQPPPPVGGSGLDGPQISLVQDLTAAQQLLAQNTEELSLKLRDGAAAAPTPGPQRDGSGAAGPSGPSPHMMRRGTKKQAPPPPKPSGPVAPPPCCGPAPPRRPSNIQPPLHAPSHPPPAPPAPGPQPWTDPEPEPSPPGTPPPPSAVPTRSGFGSLPRPRPVPKPRNRPGVLPPPQPPTLSGDSDGKMAEPLTSVQRPSRASVAELHVDQQLAAANASSCDLDTESTAL